MQKLIQKLACAFDLPSTVIVVLFIFLKVYFQVLYSLFTLYFSRTNRNNDMMTFTIHDMQGHESSWNSNCFILGFL